MRTKLWCYLNKIYFCISSCFILKRISNKPCPRVLSVCFVCMSVMLTDVILFAFDWKTEEPNSMKLCKTKT